MRLTLIAAGILALTLAAPVDAEVTSRVAAALATLPDGTAGVVTVRALGGAARALHVTRQGSRLTVFDRDTERYETFVVARSGTRVTVVDRQRSTRASYVVRQAGSRLDVLTPGGDADPALALGTSSPARGVVMPTLAASSGFGGLSLRIDVVTALGDLAETLDRIRQSPTLPDLAALSIALGPGR